MGEILDRRRAETAERVDLLRKELQDAARICRDVACVYMTGSFARREASRYSDLDVFIVGKRLNEFG